MESEGFHFDGQKAVQIATMGSPGELGRNVMASVAITSGMLDIGTNFVDQGDGTYALIDVDLDQELSASQIAKVLGMDLKDVTPEFLANLRQLVDQEKQADNLTGFDLQHTGIELDELTAFVLFAQDKGSDDQVNGVVTRKGSGTVLPKKKLERSIPAYVGGLKGAELDEARKTIEGLRKTYMAPVKDDAQDAAIAANAAQIENQGKTLEQNKNSIDLLGDWSKVLNRNLDTANQQIVGINGQIKSIKFQTGKLKNEVYKNHKQIAQNESDIFRQSVILDNYEKRFQIIQQDMDGSIPDFTKPFVDYFIVQDAQSSTAQAKIE